MTKYTDKEIVEMLHNNDNNVYKYIEVKYKPLIGAYIRKNSGVTEDLEEILQQVLITLYKMSETLVLTSRFSTFIFGIAKNLWLKELSRRYKHTEFTIDRHDMPFYDDDRDNHYRKQVVNHFLKKLQPEESDVLEKYYIDEKSMSIVATEMGYKNGNVAKTKKYKAMESLKKIVLSTHTRDELFN